MNIDSYVVWRIEDPLLFFQTIKTIEEAEARLDVLTYNNTQVKLGKLNQEDMVNEDPARGAQRLGTARSPKRSAKARRLTASR